MRSTTLRAISGPLRAATGEILLDGRALHRSPAHEILALGVAHCPEGRRLFARMTDHSSVAWLWGMLNRRVPVR